MSGMNGLEMIRKLHEIHPQIKVVILSGHSDFAYAQQAIQYKVVNYLVKPVNEDELIGVFKGVKEQLDFEKQEQDLAEAETRELRQLLGRTFFRDLLLGRITLESELAVYLKLLGYDGVNKECPLYAFEIYAKRREHDEGVGEHNPFTMEEILREPFRCLEQDFRFYMIESRPEHWRVVVMGKFQLSDGDARRSCNGKIRNFVNAVSEHLPREFVFHLTHSVIQISDLLSGANHTADIDGELLSRQMDDSLCESVVSDYKLLIVELDLGSKDTLLHIINGLVRDLRDAPLEDVRFSLKNLYSVIEMNYRKRKINIWDITKGKFDVNHLYGAEDLEDIAECLKEDFCVLCEGLHNRKQENVHSVIGRIVAYLNEHIDEDIGNDVIAAKYRIHPGYLSRLFKREMGETLSEYLLRIKIERAAELLKSGNYKVGEIAVMVGYNASSYFSVIFKKYIGYSPREYSQRISM